MSIEKENPYSFYSGFVESQDVVRVTAQIDQLAEKGSTSTELMKWVASKKEWSAYSVDWTATRMWVQAAPRFKLFVMGPEGRVLVADRTGHSEEVIDPSIKGPRGRGVLCDMRWIGKHLYVAGMSRQVYRRQAPGKWVHRDAGTVITRMPKAISGFNAIDGLSEEDIVAVGFGGEIWRCNAGKWKQLASPTGEVLQQVRAITPTLAYAAGANGALLRGAGDSWVPVKHETTKEEIWGMEWFKGSLYLSTERKLYRLSENDTLAPVSFALGKDWTCGHLHANDGVLWSFGDKHLAWTKDMKTWHDATP